MEARAFVGTNIIGVHTLLEAVRRHDIPKMVQISTDEVYGAVLEGESHEGSPFEPRSPYAASKAGADHLCHSYAITFGTPVVVTHSVNFYGPHQFPEKLIPLFTCNLMDGKMVSSCLALAVFADGRQITTVEGLDADGPHPLQRAWQEANVPQCGYCQPGQIMQAASLLAEDHAPSDDEIRDAMSGNICRCGCYERIFDGIKAAAREMRP